MALRARKVSGILKKRASGANQCIVFLGKTLRSQYILPLEIIHGL